MHNNFDGELPEGWQGGEAVTKHWRGDFIHLYRVHRPCNSCGAEIRIDVTKKALQGFTKNTGLLLRNCPSCRAVRKAGGPGSRGGTSRPVASGTPQPATAPATAVQTLPADITQHEDFIDLKQRLKEAYELNEDTCRIRRVLVEDLGLSPLADGVTPETVKAAIGELKRQLAKYELQPAIAQVAKNNLPWS